MKIEKDSLLEMQKKYLQEVGSNNSGIDKSGNEIDVQTRWIYFDKKTILNLLEKAGDEENSGIRFYFTQYTEEAIAQNPEKSTDHEGLMTLVMSPAVQKEGSISDIEGWFTNSGVQCPFHCDPVWDTYVEKEKVKADSLEK